MFIFQKKNVKHLRSVDNGTTNETFSEPAPMRSRFVVELIDGANRAEYTGELVNIDPRQLQRLVLFKPQNGRYLSDVYNANDETRVDVHPPLQIENQLPFELQIELAGPDAEFFIVEPKTIRGGVNIGAVDLTVLFKNAPLHIKDQIVGRTKLNIDIKLRASNNDYLNELLDIIATLKVEVSLLSRDAFVPKIFLVEPNDDEIQLHEDVYVNKKIATVKGVDRDRQDPGRMEYFLIGDSKLLTVDKFSGEVMLNGRLDAESQPTIEFVCFARDMDHKPLGKLNTLFLIYAQVKLNAYFGREKLVTGCFV
jgi:hypothetical protein